MASTISAGTTSGTAINISGDTSGALQLQTNGTTTAVTIDTSQNVGIGTASPSYKLDVQNNASAITTRIKNSNSTSKGGIQFDNYVSTGSGSVYYDNTNGVFTLGGDAGVPTVFNAAGTERMRIATNGQFTQIGNVNGDVIGNIINSNSSSPYGLSIYFNSAAPNNSSSFLIYSGDNTAARFVAMSNGGIKNYSANNVNLSDETVKKDITLAGNYLDKICAIPVKTFLYKDQTDTDLNLGVIAQDVYAIAPELTTETDWGTKNNPDIKLSVYESDLMFAMMKAIQELNAKVTALEAKLEAK